MKKIYILLAVFCALLTGCGDDLRKSEDDLQTEKRMQNYNLEVERNRLAASSPCGELDLKEYILDSFEPGTYLLETDAVLPEEAPKYAVVYYDKNYIFAVIAKSKRGERNIEPRNVTGYESSFINLDSSKLGTAFFYLALFQCEEGRFREVWEKVIPTHGGFNKISINKWVPRGTEYISVNFEDGIIVGSRSYNFFLIKGLTEPPHLLETYEGINAKREMADINNDEYPDYLEYVYHETPTAIRAIRSVPFIWKKNYYVNEKDPRQIREY